MSWKIIQLEIECESSVFLCAKAASPFLPAFIRGGKKKIKPALSEVGR